MKKLFFLWLLIVLVNSVFSQTVTYSTGGGITFTMTPCTKNRALSSVDFFMESKSFYHFNIYQFDYQNLLYFAEIQNGTMADFERIYNGYSFGTIYMGYNQINCIMYCNSRTGQYSLLQFADFDLGGVVHQNLKRIFERSVGQVDNL
jgi:hypothetical protein